MNLLDRLFPLLAKGKMAQEDWGVEAEGIHVLTGGSVDLAGAREHGALRFGLGGRDDVGDAHELEQPLALGIVLPCDAHRPAGELLHVLGRSRLLCLLEPLVRLLFPLEPPRQLARLELRRRAVKHVERLDAVVDHTEGAVEHAHQVRCRLAALVHELLAVGSHSDEEAVDAHRAIDLSDQRQTWHE
jgi:hypothetical protein